MKQKETRFKNSWSLGAIFRRPSVGWSLRFGDRITARDRDAVPDVDSDPEPFDGGNFLIGKGFGRFRINCVRDLPDGNRRNRFDECEAGAFLFVEVFGFAPSAPHADAVVGLAGYAGIAIRE